MSWEKILESHLQNILLINGSIFAVFNGRKCSIFPPHQSKHSPEKCQLVYNILETNPTTVSVANGEEKQSKMQCGDSGDDKLREKMDMEGDDDSWTVDCLRKRLVAERANTKVATDDAELMERKLIELEKQLKLEIESRNRAEKKLKLLTKKLESLKPSSSSGIQESDEKIRKVEDPLILEDIRLKNSETIATNVVNQVPCDEQSLRTEDTVRSLHNLGDSHEDVNEFKESLRSRESTADSIRKSSRAGEEVESTLGELNYSENALAIVPAENALAVVPANKLPDPKASKFRINDDVHDVLLALQHAKEQLQSSLEIRNFVCAQSIGLCGV